MAWTSKQSKMTQPDLDFVAPDVQLVPASATGACDVFSFGQLVCALFTDSGRPLVQADHSVATYARHIDKVCRGGGGGVKLASSPTVHLYRIRRRTRRTASSATRRRFCLKSGAVRLRTAPCRTVQRRIRCERTSQSIRGVEYYHRHHRHRHDDVDVAVAASMLRAGRFCTE